MNTEPKEEVKLTPKRVAIGTFFYVLSKFTGGLIDVGASLFETLPISFLVYMVYSKLGFMYIPFGAFWVVFTTIRHFKN